MGSSLTLRDFSKLSPRSPVLPRDPLSWLDLLASASCNHMKELGMWMSQASGTKTRLGSEVANPRRLGPLISGHFFSAYFLSTGWWTLTSQTISISANNVGFPIVTSIIVVRWISFVEADVDETSLTSTNLPKSLTAFTAKMRWHVT